MHLVYNWSMQLHFQNTSELQTLLNRIFEREKMKIKKELPYSDVQHVGSTAIPGLLTKGDLDILVRVKKEQFAEAKEKLTSLYRFDPGNPPTETYTGFDSQQYNFPLGIQLVVAEGEEDIEFTKVRDELKKNASLRERFNQLKLQFEGKERSAYRVAKTQFINMILQGNK